MLSDAGILCCPAANSALSVWICQGHCDAGGKSRLHLVVLGHVDAGKSTLMGRLLADLGVVTQKQARLAKCSSCMFMSVYACTQLTGCCQS